jgi:HSP20 family protein
MFLTRYEPQKELKALQKVFDQYSSMIDNNASTISGYIPKVNTSEDEKAYHIDIDLAGVKKEDISVDVDNNTIKIYGERKYKNEKKEDDYYKIESSFGRFERVFSLPENVDIESISAKHTDGVLEMVLPKVEQQNSKKRINIT